MKAMFKKAFTRGLGMVLDLSGSALRRDNNPSVSNGNGISSDWERVGKMIQTATNNERRLVKAQKQVNGNPR